MAQGFFLWRVQSVCLHVCVCGWVWVSAVLWLGGIVNLPPPLGKSPSPPKETSTTPPTHTPTAREREKRHTLRCTQAQGHLGTHHFPNLPPSPSPLSLFSLNLSISLLSHPVLCIHTQDCVLTLKETKISSKGRKALGSRCPCALDRSLINFKWEMEAEEREWEKPP